MGNVVKEPHLLNVLDDTLGHSVLKPVEYSTDDFIEIDPEATIITFSYFDNWARRHRAKIKKFKDFHYSPFVMQDQNIRVANKYTYDLSSVARLKQAESLASFLSLDIENIIYLYDLVLRMPMYGLFAGEDNYYLNHPIRDGFGGCYSEEKSTLMPPIPMTFAPSFRAMTDKLTIQDYAKTVSILRDLVREYRLIGARPNDIDIEVAREIAAIAKLPANFSKTTSLASTIAASILSAAVGAFFTGLSGFAAGGSIGVLSTFWAHRDIHAPTFTNHKWLRWSRRYMVEDNLNL